MLVSVGRGIRVCRPDGTWNPVCESEVVPEPENCSNNLDDDCDGHVDNVDQDGDGWGICDGDCCDDENAGCIYADLVNPGAFEVDGNDVDDNCNGEIDEVMSSCDTQLDSDTPDARHFAQALDLCQFTEEHPPLAERRWGVLDASLTQADGQLAPIPVQHAVRPGFGSGILPSSGQSLVVLSTGHAADSDDNNPAFSAFETGRDLGLDDSDAPEPWLSLNDGVFPNPAGCPDPWDTKAHDSVMLTIDVRVPTNARSFSTRMFFMTAEYPEYVCSPFNDFFVTLVTSDSDANPC